MDRFDEQTFLMQCISGDRNAYEPVVRQYERPLLGMLYNLVGNIEEAQDLTQETFIRAYQKLEMYDPDRPFRNLLFTIARNLYRDRLRCKKASTSLDALMERGTFSLCDESAPTDSEAIRNETRNQVWVALGRLDPDAREVLILKDIERLCYEEIAGILNVPEGTVAGRVYYARRALKDILLRDGSVSRVPAGRTDRVMPAAAAAI